MTPLLVIAALLGAACAPTMIAGIRADAETMPWADLAGFGTYRWWQPPIGQVTRGYSEREALVDWHVREAVDRELGSRGYAPDTAGAPDFVVRYTIGLFDDSTSSFQEYVAYRAEGGEKDMGQAFMGYERGMLTIELVDVRTRRVAWRGRATAVAERDHRGKQIAPAVAKMMAELPAAGVRP